MPISTCLKGGLVNNDGKSRAISIVQIIVAALVVVGVAWLVFKMVGYHQAQQVYRDIETAYADDLGAARVDASNNAANPSPVDFAALQQQYPDVVAWLKMDDVDVSYPIVKGTDNEHYLDYDPAGQPNIAGSVFLDSRNKSFSDDLHAIVYAHNMLDESMFGPLDSYTDESFYRGSTGGFTIYTPEGAYRYVIFAVEIVNPTDDAYQVGFSNTQVFEAYLNNLKAGSMYDTGIDVSGSDHVVTLSTCSANDRLIVSAKRVYESEQAK